MRTSKLGAEAVKFRSGGVEFIQFPRLADPQVLAHAVSTRLGGVSSGNQGGLNLSFKVGDEPLRVGENRSLLSRALGIDLSRAVTLEQVHSDRVLTLDAANRPPTGGDLGKGDGIITRLEGVPILILVADCLPVLFFDPVHKAVGLSHAGWRGTVNHVAAKTLVAMGEAYGTKPEEARAALGPCIGPCCYEVGEDVKKEFDDVFPWSGEVLRPSSVGHWKLDLAEANARQLREFGMEEGNLIRAELCTIGNMELFYSHRAEAGPERPTGRIGAVMMLV